MSKTRMDRRLDGELAFLRSKGCYATLQFEGGKKMVSIDVRTLKRENAKKIVILLGLFKYRKTFLNVIGKDVVNYIANLEAKTYNIQLDVTRHWPFDAPHVSMKDFNVSNITWNVEDRLYSIVEAFKKYQETFVPGSPFKYEKDSHFFFVEKRPENN